MERTTWVEVSESALGANFAAVERHVGVPVCAVVKANAYGHGLVPAARVFVRSGAAMLAVARLEEARALREAGIDVPILILIPIPDPSEAVELDCAITIGSESEIAALPSGARAHLKVDTGMGRLGVRPAQALDAARAIAARATLTGIFTHFADAAGGSGPRQLERFGEVVRALHDDGIEAPAHAANSAAVCALPRARFDMVRPGTLLYGQHPAGGRAPFALAETFVWYARVAEVHSVPAGSTVGYGSEWRAPRAVRIATLPVVYADGFLVEPDARSDTARTIARRSGTLALRAIGAGQARRRVWFGDRAASVVGRVAMQATTVSLEGLDDVVAGAVARIPARRLLVSSTIERVYV
jgi:alanine racemase